MVRNYTNAEFYPKGYGARLFLFKKMKNKEIGLMTGIHRSVVQSMLETSRNTLKQY